jgi:1,4-alpha-glucan branching enzyme
MATVQMATQKARPDGINMLPIDIRGGIHHNLLAPNTLTFVLYAPFKPYVSLIGDFNQWNSRANRMVTDGRGVWWTTIPHPGETRYGYYVAIDEQSHVWVGDPYAQQLAWSDDGPWAYLPAASAAFCWTDQAWQTPALRDLTLYELCVRDFAGYWQANRPHLGTFQDLIGYVDYFTEIGINAVELMPIQAFPGTSSWGYNPVFYFAPSESYGTPTDLKEFVNRCHSRGIAVIMDVAFNHAWGDHPYYQAYPPMYGPKGEWLPNWNPFFHHTPSAINSWGGLDWDHFKPETTRYFQDVVRFWLNEYHIDGFRFDWVGGVEYDSRNPMNPHFNPYHGIGAICWAARQAKADCILIAEHWQLEGTHPDKSPAKLVHETEMDACWNGEFHHTLDDVLNQRWAWEQKDIFRAIGGFREQGFTSATQIVNYSCSHDEVRPEHEIIFYSQRHITRPPDMTVHELARIKALLGLVTLFAAPGVPMLYAGQEFAEDTPRTIDFQPLQWAKLQNSSHADYWATVKRLVRARAAHPALRSDHITFDVNDFAQEYLVRLARMAYGADNTTVTDFVAVALNFGPNKVKTTLSLPWRGGWTDVVTGKQYRPRGPQWQGTLAPWQAVMLVTTTTALLSSAD